MNNVMVNTKRGKARWIGKAEDDYLVFDSIEYEDVKVEGKWYSVSEFNTFTAYTEEGELICAAPDIVTTISEFKEKYNFTIKQISERFSIPYRTVQNWNANIRECPSYIIKMMIEIIDNEKLL